MSVVAGIAVFGQLGLAAEGAGLDGCQVHSTELQKLAVMLKAAQIASLRQDGQRIDRPDPWDGCQQLIVFVGLEQFDCAVLDLVTLAIKLRPSARTSLNIRAASESAAMGRPTDDLAVW